MYKLWILILVGVWSILVQAGSGPSQCVDLIDQLEKRRSWPQSIFQDKIDRIKTELVLIFNTKPGDSNHTEGIKSVRSLSKGRMNLINLHDVRRLKDIFIRSLNEGESRYDAGTARTLVLILSEYIPQEPEILPVFSKILDDPQYLKLSSSSAYSHLLVKEVVVSALKDYVEEHPELLSLLERQLTEMDDFYIGYPNAHKNQTAFLQTAVESIITDVGQLVTRYPDVIYSLFKRLSLLYENKLTSYEDAALIEKYRITIKTIREQLKPEHIFRLAQNENESIRTALVKFFTRDFHFPSKEILEEVEKLLVYKQQPYVRETGILILAGRELAGKGKEPYVQHNFDEPIEWLQPPTIAPSRLTEANMRLIYELSQDDKIFNVRRLAQEVVKLVEENREDIRYRIAI